MLKNETLERWLDSINRRVGRPAVGYARKDEDGVQVLRALPGHLHTTANSPGDGWTRYRLAEMYNEGGGISHLISDRACTRAEYEAQLRGVIAGLDLAAAAFDQVWADSDENEYMDTGEVLRILDALRDGR